MRFRAEGTTRAKSAGPHVGCRHGSILVTLAKPQVTSAGLAYPSLVRGLANLQCSGSICALVTPFLDDGTVDYASLESLLQWHADAGTTTVVLGGSTGESGALEAPELVQMVQRARLSVGNRLPIWAGVGGGSSAKALDLGRQLVAAGADVLLAVTPFYSRPPQEGLYRHYKLLADELAAPIILYNVPSRTGVDLQPDTVRRLCDHAQVLGIKEAVSRAERLQALLALRRPDFAILSGDDGSCAEWMMQGADGVVSVVANVVPQQLSMLARLAASDRVACAALNRRLQVLIAALDVAPNPIPIKSLLSTLGRCGPALRLPLTELEPQPAAALRKAYELAIAD